MISGSAGSWGKVKIPKCADFDGVFRKKFFRPKNYVFYLIFDDFPDFLSILGMQKISEIQKIEIFGILIKKSSYSVFMCLNHPVSERISSSGHFGIFIVHTTRVMRYFIHTEVVAQIFKIGQIQV